MVTDEEKEKEERRWRRRRRSRCEERRCPGVVPVSPGVRSRAGGARPVSLSSEPSVPRRQRAGKQQQQHGSSQISALTANFRPVFSFSFCRDKTSLQSAVKMFQAVCVCLVVVTNICRVNTVKLRTSTVSGSQRTPGTTPALTLGGEYHRQHQLTSRKYF